MPTKRDFLARTSKHRGAPHRKANTMHWTAVRTGEKRIGSTSWQYDKG
eukprot:CAMPEP_0203908116 /NCGR_PEP_ID=MMETSP0359-20131031/49540_1 /ASSEMBLY_ACC=CAM_ASM_000338 /TAXON_ID=268821 /ORGANISM="Scrippsiella Hangoei, Strain SHTV-5" /LENGTH=47 /DNA_ID= /DNA_START= /DNA_END= /DNA_ORIENTATION=